MSPIFTVGNIFKILPGSWNNLYLLYYVKQHDFIRVSCEILCASGIGTKNLTDSIVIHLYMCRTPAAEV